MGKIGQNPSLLPMMQGDCDSLLILWHNNIASPKLQQDAWREAAFRFDGWEMAA
jgi:hypothetical protein